MGKTPHCGLKYLSRSMIFRLRNDERCLVPVPGCSWMFFLGADCFSEGQEDFSGLSKKEKESLFSCVMYCSLAALAYVPNQASQASQASHSNSYSEYLQWIDLIANHTHSWSKISQVRSIPINRLYTHSMILYNISSFHVTLHLEIWNETMINDIT